MYIPLLVVVGEEKLLLDTGKRIRKRKDPLDFGENKKRRNNMPKVKGYTRKVHGKKVHVHGYSRKYK